MHVFSITPFIFIQKEEADEFNPSKYFDTPPEFLTRAYNRPTNQLLSEGSVVSNPNLATTRRLAVRRAKAYGELDARMKRSQEMKKAYDKMNIQKELMSSRGTAQKRKRPNGDAVYTWKKQRTK